MVRSLIEEHLAAERHVGDAERRLQRQGEIVDQLNRDGHDSTAARLLLHQFDELLTLLLADRERLRFELRRSNPDAPAIGKN
jgi:hypothetical protein